MNRTTPSLPTSAGSRSILRTSAISNLSSHFADDSIRTGATFGATLLAIYIFLLESRILDLSFIGYFHIPMMLLIALSIMTLAKGGIQLALSFKATKFFTAFTFWVAVCTPFSIWRVGSLPYLQTQVQALMIFFILVQLVKTKRDWERVTTAYAWATLAAALISFKWGVAVEGRVALANGALGDPNAFAMFMVVGLPFWWLKASRSQGFRKVAYLLCTLPIYPALARAGSRSGMLAMCVLLAVTFYFADGGRKVLIVALAIAGAAVTFVALPSYLRARYFTFFESDNSVYSRRLSADIQSSEGRRMLLMQSITMTFQHPVLGVGPGQFGPVAWTQRRLGTAAPGAAYVSHNTYTQISSETGFPGFFLFVGTIVLCFRYTMGDYRQLFKVDPDFAQCGRYLFSSLAALCLGIFFLSTGYTHLLSIVFALATSLHLIVNTYLRGATQIGKIAPSGSALSSATPAVGTVNTPGISPIRKFHPPQARRPRYRPAPVR